MSAPDPFVALMRRYVNDYTNRHDTSVCEQIMEPGYVLRMGPHEVAGRDDAYIPAAQRQFTQYPGLCLTVHALVTDGTRLAMRFSEHGRAARDGKAAVWSGIGLYLWNGHRLLSNFVEQDYLSRRHQLATGTPGTVEPPALAPWDTEAEPPDQDAETLVRQWIATGAAAGSCGPVRFEGGEPGAPLLTDATSTVDDLFSAGEHVAFRVTAAGGYAGGLGTDAADAAVGTPATLHLVGLVSVTHGRIAGGQIVRDRLGMARALARPALAT